MEHATDRLDLQWRHKEGGVAHSRLDERFLSGHNLPAPVSLPFLPDLHNEIVKAWDKPYSARIHRYKHANYADIEWMREHEYASMPPIEGTLASYLSAGGTSTLKAPALPSKPLQDTSHLNGRAYVAAGLAGAALHMMAVLQAYQADLLKDLDQEQGLPPLRRYLSCAAPQIWLSGPPSKRLPRSGGRWWQWWPLRGTCG